MSDDNAKELLQSLISKFKDVTLFEGKSKVRSRYGEMSQSTAGLQVEAGVLTRGIVTRWKPLHFGHLALSIDKCIRFLVLVLYYSRKASDARHKELRFRKSHIGVK